MKRELYIDASLVDGNELLSQVMSLVRDLPTLEAFVWTSFSGSQEGRLWLVIKATDDQLRDLVAALHQLPGVRQVHEQGPSSATLDRLLATSRT